MNRNIMSYTTFNGPLKPEQKVVDDNASYYSSGRTRNRPYTKKNPKEPTLEMFIKKYRV